MPLSKDHPLSMRLSETEIATIDRASSLCGLSRTDFVRHAAIQAAETVLMAHTPVDMGEDGFTALVAAVSAPAAPVPELVELFARKAPWDEVAETD